MRQQRTALVCSTQGPGFHDLTRQISHWLTSIDAQNGCVTLFIRHTSASLTIQENADPDVLSDLADRLADFAPQGHAYRHNSEGPDDMPAHIKTMLTNVSLNVPVEAGQMMLGTWQAVYLIEHRTAPHSREIVVHYMGE